MRKRNNWFQVYLLLIFLGCFSYTSCEHFKLQEKNQQEKSPIASLDNAQAYLSDFERLFPKNIPKNDSLVLLKSNIDNWALKLLLLKKAQESNSQEENDNVNQLVQNYRESLLINNYKEKLIKQQLDTLIPFDEIVSYYLDNLRNFKLNEPLIKFKYIYIGHDFVDKKEIIKLFKSNNIEDLESLEDRQLSFKSFHLNDSVWLPLDKVLLKIPYTKEKLLKKIKFKQKEDSLGLYLVSVKDVLNRNDFAPLSYVNATVKQMILHQRKLELIRKIEKIIIKDAVQTKRFKVY